MNIATVLTVFKHSSIITPQGEYKISRVFPSGKAARKAGYIYHCTSNGVDIYTRHRRNRITRFAVVGK